MSKVKGREVREPLENMSKGKDGFIGDFGRESETVGDAEKRFGHFKVGLSPLRNLMMCSHSSSGKYEHVTAIVLQTFYLDEVAAAIVSHSIHSFTIRFIPNLKTDFVSIFSMG